MSKACIKSYHETPNLTVASLYERKSLIISSRTAVWKWLDLWRHQQQFTNFISPNLHNQLKIKKKFTKKLLTWLIRFPRNLITLHFNGLPVLQYFTSSDKIKSEEKTENININTMRSTFSLPCHIQSLTLLSLRISLFSFISFVEQKLFCRDGWVYLERSVPVYLSPRIWYPPRLKISKLHDV